MSDFAGEQYKKARKAGIKAFREAGGKGRYPYLTSLDEILLHTKTAGTEDLGVCEIPLSRVTGTKTASRSESFAWNFMPLLREKTEFSGKWERLYEAQMEEGIREPVKVYEYMHHFYVREGNKRVSVMKYVGAVKITADVTRIFPKRDGKCQGSSEESTTLIRRCWQRHRHNIKGKLHFLRYRRRCGEKASERCCIVKCWII